MKYQANPVVVDAHEIVSVETDENGHAHCALRNGANIIATAAMVARMTPSPGDYLVIQQDGYEYLNPKAVFERKYSLIKEEN